MEKMSYQDAKKIRAKSFGDIMANKLAEGQGIGSSFKATLSEKSAARMKGFKEKFDPLNIAKFITGGSKLAPALLGRLTGRNSKDIKYFAGVKDKRNDTATKLEGGNGGFAANNQMIESLLEIYDLLKDSEENKKKDKERESQFAEEKLFEKERSRDRRHKELMEAITGKPYETATKVTEEDPTIFDKLFDKLYDKIIDKVLGKFAKWFLLADILTGVALPVAALMAPWLLTIYQRSKIEEDPNNPEWKDTPYAKFIRGEAKTQGAAAAQNQRNVIKEVSPQYAKDLLAASPKFTDAELVEETGKNRKELEEWVATNPKSNLKFENKQVPTTMEKESGNEQFKKESEELVNKQTSVPPAMETPTVGQKLESVQAENLNSKIQEKTAVGQTVVNNAIIKSAMESAIIDGPLLPVRNMEESYQDMIFYSTRIV